MANTNTLKARWSKKESDILIYYPCTADGAFVAHQILNSKVQQELKDRGYDLTTIKFSIQKNKA